MESLFQAITPRPARPLGPMRATVDIALALQTPQNCDGCGQIEAVEHQ